ncbi:MAG: YggS family pyridoxal phosphate-dependent enzyme [Dehalococcoidia bacterium]
MRLDEIAANVAGVRARVAAACERAGRDPASVTLIAVTKSYPAADVLAAHAAGIADVGENRVQEGLAKRVEADVSRLRWHLIGHLQTNKARLAVDHFDVLHGIDSARALTAVDDAADRAGRVAPVFLEVNVAGEASKDGIPVEALAALVAHARSLAHIRVEGLMTVAPHAPDPEQVRPVFVELRRLAASHGLESLSMGMTGDFEAAIEAGATHIRVGRAIFGERVA